MVKQGVRSVIVTTAIIVALVVGIFFAVNWNQGNRDSISDFHTTIIEKEKAIKAKKAEKQVIEEKIAEAEKYKERFQKKATLPVGEGAKTQNPGEE